MTTQYIANVNAIVGKMRLRSMRRSCESKSLDNSWNLRRSDDPSQLQIHPLWMYDAIGDKNHN
jgi:hypothetical protein